MACRYYDDILIAKIKRWIPDDSNLRVLKPEESKRLFELTADENKDQAFKLPIIALSRTPDIELLLNIKNNRSFDGLDITPRTYDTDGKVTEETSNGTFQLNIIPIKLEYQLDIYTKTFAEADEYVRTLLFKLINNPQIRIDIPYNDQNIKHTANIRVLPTVSDTSDIAERIFSGQFTRWTIQLEIQDAFLFSIPYRKNWKLYINPNETLLDIEKSALELSPNIRSDGELEAIPLNFKRQ